MGQIWLPDHLLRTGISVIIIGQSILDNGITRDDVLEIFLLTVILIQITRDDVFEIFFADRNLNSDYSSRSSFDVGSLFEPQWNQYASCPQGAIYLDQSYSFKAFKINKFSDLRNGIICNMSPQKQLSLHQLAKCKTLISVTRSCISSANSFLL